MHSHSNVILRAMWARFEARCALIGLVEVGGRGVPYHTLASMPLHVCEHSQSPPSAATAASFPTSQYPIQALFE